MTVISPGPVPGSTLLPGGFRHPHASQEARAIAQQGMILRMQTDDVRAIGRATQGVRLIDIEADDKVVSVARLVEKEEEIEKDQEPQSPE